MKELMINNLKKNLCLLRNQFSKMKFKKFSKEKSCLTESEMLLNKKLLIIKLEIKELTQRMLSQIGPQRNLLQ